MYHSFLLFQERMTKRHFFIVELHWEIGSQQIPHIKSMPDGVLPASVLHMMGSEFVLKIQEFPEDFECVVFSACLR